MVLVGIGSRKSNAIINLDVTVSSEIECTKPAPEGDQAKPSSEAETRNLESEGRVDYTYRRGGMLRCGALALTGRPITPQTVGPISTVTPTIREETSLLGVLS